jgi:hypothetical protein
MAVTDLKTGRMIDCKCPNTGCRQHGDCSACRSFHASAKTPRPPYCERKPSLWRMIFRQAQGAANH